MLQPKTGAIDVLWRMSLRMISQHRFHDVALQPVPVGNGACSLRALGPAGALRYFISDFVYSVDLSILVNTPPSAITDGPLLLVGSQSAQFGVLHFAVPFPGVAKEFNIKAWRHVSAIHQKKRLSFCRALGCVCRKQLAALALGGDSPSPHVDYLKLPSNMS